MDVRLEIERPSGGVIHLTEFQSVTIQLTARGAGSFSVAVPPTVENRSALREAMGGTFRCWVDGGLQLVGILDERSDDTAMDATDLHLAGRDLAGLLADCPVPANRLRIADKTLQQIADDWIKPYAQWIPGVDVDAAVARYMASSLGRGARAAAKASGLRIVERDGKWVAERVTRQSRYRRPRRAGRRSPYYAGVGTEQLTGSSVRLGMAIWPALEDLCAQVGVAPTMAPDGTLLLYRPSYDRTELYREGLVLHWDAGDARARRSNVQGIRISTTIAPRRSEWWISGAGKPKKTARGSEILRRHVVKDPGPAFWDDAWGARLRKPGVIQASRIGNTSRLVRYARRHVGETIRASLSWEAEVRGWTSPSGVLWIPDTMVRVDDQRNGISSYAYIQGVRREYTLTEGATTRLSLTLPDLVMGALDDPGMPDEQWAQEIRSRIWW